MNIAYTPVTTEASLFSISLEEKPLYIVSDRFASFADDDTVMSYSTALDFLPEHSQRYDRIIIGQGINHEEIAQLHRILENITPYGPLSVMEKVSDKAPRECVHKVQEANVLITTPKRDQQGSFWANLVVDDDCAEMADHQTGEHIQGSILVEAARQMFMACSVVYNVAPEFQKRSGPIKFALSQMQVNFHNFIFPVDTQIELVYGDIETRNSGASGSCQVRFYQLSELCCEVFCSANAYPDKVLSFLETRSANKMRKKIIQSPTHMPQAVCAST